MSLFLSRLWLGFLCWDLKVAGLPAGGQTGLGLTVRQRTIDLASGHIFSRLWRANTQVRSKHLFTLSTSSTWQSHNSKWDKIIGIALLLNLWNWEPPNYTNISAASLRKQMCFWCQSMWPSITLGAQSPAQGSWVGIICSDVATWGKQSPFLPPPAALRVIIHHEADRHCPLEWHALAWLTFHNWWPETCLGLSTINFSVTHKWYHIEVA